MSELVELQENTASLVASSARLNDKADALITGLIAARDEIARLLAEGVDEAALAAVNDSLDEILTANAAQEAEDDAALA